MKAFVIAVFCGAIGYGQTDAGREKLDSLLKKMVELYQAGNLGEGGWQPSGARASREGFRSSERVDRNGGQQSGIVV